MSVFLEALGLKWVPLAAGFIGSLVSLKYIEGITIWQRATTVLGGGIAAAYCTPLAVAYLGLTPKMEGPIGFLFGLFGMSLVGALMKAIPGWVDAAKSRVFGGGQ